MREQDATRNSNTCCIFPYHRASTSVHHGAVVSSVCIIAIHSKTFLRIRCIMWSRNIINLKVGENM
jgi:hypothetical protein